MTAAWQKRVGLALLGVMMAATPGCSWFSKSTPADSAAAGQSAPAKSLRERGAQIADESMLQDLVQGRTTKAEVLDKFGIPQQRVFVPGMESFLYVRERSKGWFSPTCERTEMLTVRFDAQGVLKDFEYRLAGQ